LVVRLNRIFFDGQLQVDACEMLPDDVADQMAEQKGGRFAGVTVSEIRDDEIPIAILMDRRQIPTVQELCETLLHELIHVWDLTTFKAWPEEEFASHQSQLAKEYTREGHTSAFREQAARISEVCDSLDFPMQGIFSAKDETFYSIDTDEQMAVLAGFMQSILSEGELTKWAEVKNGPRDADRDIADSLRRIGVEDYKVLMIRNKMKELYDERFKGPVASERVVEGRTVQYRTDFDDLHKAHEEKMRENERNRKPMKT
jgi:hypothetical protein